MARRAVSAPEAGVRTPLAWLCILALSGCTSAPVANVGPEGPVAGVEPSAGAASGDAAARGADAAERPGDPDASPGPAKRDVEPPASPGDRGADGSAPVDGARGAEPASALVDAVADADPEAAGRTAADLAPERADRSERRWSEALLDRLTIEEKIGQMIMPSVLGDFAPEGSERHVRDIDYIERHGIGGVVMSVGSPTEVAAKLNDLQRHARIPLLVAADLETGAGFRMRGAVHTPGNIDLGGATDFPAMMALGATGDAALAYEMGRVTAVEALALGIHVPFAPVLDVNNNPANPIINIRSFGEEPELVARMGVSFVRGLQDQGVVATGKHFPGHGDTEADSHLELPVILHERNRMDSVELRPFREAIEAGLGGVMTAHIAVPGLDGGDRTPSTLSAAVLTDLLRDELRFDGLVFTDAMDMGAINRRFGPREATVRAVEAGADVVLMPPSVELAHQALVAAVRSGRLTEARIDASVRRILAIKEQLGLHERAVVPIEDIPRRVGIPEHRAVADRIAERSITLLRNRRGLLPLVGTRSARVLSVTYKRRTDVLAGRFFDQRLRQTYRRLRTADVDEDTDPAVYEDLLGRARGQALVVVSTYVAAVSGSGSVSLPEEMVAFIDGLRRIGRPHVLISFGNPYLIAEVPEVRAYMLAWGRSEASQVAAARALFGEFPLTGRTPTAIPPFFEIGDGIPMPRRERRAGDR